MSERYKAVVVGAGAMGCLFAARMSEAGSEVTLVDVDEARLRTLAESGIELTDDSGTRVVRLRTTLAADISGPVDLVVLFTKGMHSQTAAASVAFLRESEPMALTLQNGIGNAEVLAEVFGKDQVILGTAMVPADFAQPNRIATHGFSTLHIGGFTDVAHERVGPIAQLLERSRFAPVVTPDIEKAVWIKLAFNAALNALAMITESDNGALDNPYGRRIALRSINETVEVARQRGLDLDVQEIEKQVDAALVRHPAHEASMLQDRRAFRRTEIETINGAIVTEGRKYGISTPVNELLSDLVRMIEMSSLRKAN